MDDRLLPCYAAQALAAIGKDAGEAVKPLEIAARGSVPEVRAFAAYAVFRITGRDEGVVESLMAAMHITAWEVAILDTLGELGPLAAPSVPKVLAKLSSDQTIVRCHAAEALGSIPSDSAEVLSALSKAIADEDSLVAAAATRSLAARGRTAAAAIPLLGPAAGSEHGGVRTAFCRAVTSLGRRARCLAEDLVPLVGNDETRPLALEALRAIGTEEAAAALVKIHERFRCARLDVLGTLEALGPAARSALPYVEGVASSPETPDGERAAARAAVAAMRRDE
jgi:HEAT repeat protein